MKTTKTAYLAASLGFLVSALAASASVTVSLGGSTGTTGSSVGAPTANVFASTENDAVDSSLGWRWDTNQTPAERDVSQSFTTGASSVLFNAITFKEGGSSISSVFKDNSAITFTLSIYKLTSITSAPNDSTSTLVSQQSGNFAGFASDRAAASGNITDSQGDYVTFSLDGVTLAANSIYSVVLSFTVSGQNYSLTLANNGNTTFYTGGDALFSTDGGTTWTKGQDYIFYAQGVSAIPEPASVSLALAGAAGLAGLVLKRRRGAGK